MLLYVNLQNPDVDEIWDDSALIDAYDKAVRKAKVSTTGFNVVSSVIHLPNHVLLFD